MQIADLIGAHDKQLEQTLLACAFAHPECLAEPWAVMPPEVFYLESHRRLWQEMTRQYRGEQAFDFSTIDAAFRATGNTKIVQEVIVPCLGVYEGNYHPNSAYARLYAQQLKKLYVMREKARATLTFQAALKTDEEQAEARMILDATLTALDSSVQQFDERTDEEVAALLGPEARQLTGVRDLDDLTGGMARPGLNLLASRPSVGKSALARTIIRAAAAKGHRVLLYSQDQAESQIMELEIARHRRIDTSRVRSLERAELVKSVKQVRSEVWRGLVQVIDTPLKLGQLMQAVKIATPALLVVDYVQIIDAGLDSEYESITAVSKALKTLAFELRIPVLAIAQLNRSQGPNGTPSLAQLRGSGQLEQDADQVWVLERDTTQSSTEEQEATLYVLKNKVGPTGRVTLHWRGKFASFESHAPLARASGAPERN